MAKNPQKRPFPRNWFTEELTLTDGSLTHDRTTVSGSQNTDGAGYYLVDTSGGAVTLTIDSDDAEDGRELNVKRDGSNSLTVDTEGSATIDGSASIEITQDKQTVTVVYDGGSDDWQIF